MSTASLVSTIKSLPEPQFERVLSQLLAFRTRKFARSPSSRERDLLADINRGAPPRLLQEQRALLSRKRDARLSEAEQGRLLEITDKLEAFSVRWTGWLVELAGLRGISVAQLMRALELPAKPYV